MLQCNCRISGVNRPVRRNLVLLTGIGLLGSAAPVYAQQAPSPSQVTPRSLAPDTAPQPVQIAIPDSNGLHAPAGAEAMTITPGSVTVEGGFPEVGAQTDRISAGLQGKRVTLAQIYAAASEIEAVHARAGYVLARVAIPPQKLSDGGPLRIVVVDGFIDDVSLDGVPSRSRRAVAARLDALKGERHLTLAEIQQPLLIAGDTPGLRLTSTLMRGDETGGTKLVLDGKQHLLTGSLNFDNNLPSSLDTYGLSAQLALNSALGLGEQIYGFAGGGYDLSRMFDGSARARVLGGGVIMPLGNGRLTVNPEVTFSRTQPIALPGVPLTRGDLRRLTLRAGYVAARHRDHSLTLNATVEQIDETNLLTQFGLQISHDRFMAARIGLDYLKIRPTGGYTTITVQASQGLGGLGALRMAALPSGVTYSRDGAHLDYTKLTGSLRSTMPLAPTLWLNLSARGQTSFGRTLFRSEQALLEGADGLSSYVGAVTSVDSGAVARGELAGAFTYNGVQIAPYGFGAGGIGKIERPTAVEQGSLHAASAGAGIRFTLPKAGLSLSGEYARGFASIAALDKVDRVNVSAALRF